MTLNRDNLKKRCPRLGGPVTFHYCRIHGEVDLPCWKIFDCWWETFDVVAFMKDLLTDEQFDRLMRARPKPKLASLVEMIDQAKRRTKADKSSV